VKVQKPSAHDNLSVMAEADGVMTQFLPEVFFYFAYSFTLGVVLS
jgi:hypothetical protein